MTKDKLINWAIFILLSFIWGSSFILMKESSKVLTGVQIASLRIFSAGLVFFPFAFFHFKQIPKAKISYVVLSGVLGNLLPAFLFAIAIDQKVESSLAGILNSLTPLFVIILGSLCFKASIASQKIIGVLVGLIGLVILSSSKNGLNTATLKPALLILIATISYGLNVNVVSMFLKGVAPIHTATVSLAFMLLPASFLVWQQDLTSIIRYDEGSHWPVFAASLLGVVGSAIATAFFYILIKRAGGLFASLVTYGIPVVAIFWGLLAHKQITLIQMICLLIILSGVYWANKSTR